MFGWQVVAFITSYAGGSAVLNCTVWQLLWLQGEVRQHFGNTAGNGRGHGNAAAGYWDARAGIDGAACADVTQTSNLRASFWYSLPRV